MGSINGGRIKMRFLILNTDYLEFLGWLYAQHSGLENQSYEEQLRVRRESLFGLADFYSVNLCKLGHEAQEIYVNNEFMQKAWAKEQGVKIKEAAGIFKKQWGLLRKARTIGVKTPLRYLHPFFRPFLRRLDKVYFSWFYDILIQQIKHYKPDILLNQAMYMVRTQFLKEVKPYLRLLVGQIASPLPRDENFSIYDLIISSLPNFVSYFRSLGISSEIHRLGFEPRILSPLKEDDSPISLSFVGSLSPSHKSRIALLEYLCNYFEIKIWGVGIENLPKESPIHKHFMGNAWGIQMYKILKRSRIVLNSHIDIANSWANNMRLFETTGVGTFLITDGEKNLHEIFEPGKEVVLYRTPEECAKLIKYYLEHEEERKDIARAGQKRTLREHTYLQRMQELVEIVKKYL